MRKTITVFFQLLVGATFIFSGISKCIDPMGSSIKIAEYLNHFSMPALADWSMCMAWLLSVLEFFVGLCLFFGNNRKFSLAFASLFMLAFTPLTLYLAIANPVDDCGCFGDAWVLSNWETFWKNVVLSVAVVWLVVCRKQMCRILSKSLFTFYSYGALIVVLVLCGLGTWRLPYIDFRPYRPGVNLRQEALGVSNPSDEGVGYVCVYQKDGKLQDFPLEQLPDEDSGWEFVESKEVHVGTKGDTQMTSLDAAGKSGRINWIESFFVCDKEGNAQTEELLSDTGYVFLLISPSLGKASEHDVDRIEQLYEYSLEQGHPFYCLTLHDEAQEEKWRYRTGAKYSMLYSDATVLETMIRANPGFMLLHDGVILWKTHLAELDVTEMTSAKLSEQSYGKVLPINRRNKLFWLAVCLFAPLLLYLPLQFAKKSLTKNIKTMRKKIVAGNWKMNTTLQEGVALAEGLKEALAGKKVNCDVVVCTPFISVASVAKAVEGSIIGVGAEDCSAHDKGAYTGEVAANMIASTGAKYVILGHSERRQYHGENNELLVAKLQQALANGLTPIFCVGEVKEERENGTFKAVIEGQMEAMYTLSAEDFAKCVVAYEPVWAIGTGLTATSEQAQEVHAFIRASIAAKYNAEVAENTSILYGGSCKGSNAPELFAMPDIDGGLIGGAALKVDTFMPIIEAWK